jgi:hypothetical protein
LHIGIAGKEVMLDVVEHLALNAQYTRAARA